MPLCGSLGHILLICCVALAFGASAGGCTADEGSAPEELSPTSVFARAANSHGQELVVRVAPQGAPDVYLGTRKLTRDDAIEFDPQINDRGHTAWARTLYDNAASEVVLDGEVIFARERTLNQKLLLTEAALYWLAFEERSLQNSLCRFDIDQRSTGCVELELFGQELAAVGQDLLLAGFAPDRGLYQVLRFDEDLGEAREVSSSAAPMILARGPTPRVIRVAGDRAPRTVFFALWELVRDQLGEPFAGGDDGMGRLAWNVAYRLEAMNDLYQKTGDERLIPLIRSTVERMLQSAGPEEVFWTRKYSIDHETSIVLLVNNACIYHALLRSAPVLGVALSSDVIQRAEAMFESFEQDWVEPGYYRSRPGQRFAFDGAPLPLNRQNMMGLVALRLYELTGRARYGARVEALYEGMLEELEEVDGVPLWHYHHSLFYQGWEPGTYESTHMPRRDPSADTRFEDYSHARINIEFLLQASAMLGRPAPIDVDAIASNLAVAPFRYARFISGRTDEYEASYAYLPPLPQAEAMGEVFAAAVVTPTPGFDRQDILRSHARAALLDDRSQDWRMKVEEFGWEGGALQPLEIHTFEGDQAGGWRGLMSYWLSRSPVR